MLFRSGVGVVVFFLISGYIITFILQREALPEYAIKRVFRIYPLYVFAVVIQYALLSRSGMQPSLNILLLQTSLLGDFFQTPYTLGGVE